MHLPAVVEQLRKIAGPEAVLDRPEDLMLYEYDAGVRKCTPTAVVFPQNTEQVAQIVRLAAQAGIENAPVVRLADRYAAWFLPLTLLVAGGAWLASGSPVRAVLIERTSLP